MISFGSELFRRVVSYVGGKPAEAVLEERDRLRSPSRPLEDDPKLKDLIDDVNSDIATLFGRPSQLKLRLTTTDSDGLLEVVVPHFAESSGVTIPSRRQGNGLISLQTLILLMRFGRLRVEKGEGFLMALEEPELHVAPPLQRKLLHLLQALTTQIIILRILPAVDGSTLFRLSHISAFWPLPSCTVLGDVWMSDSRSLCFCAGVTSAKLSIASPAI
jgi:putative ATP-dependent endonuclease of the OLD family